MKKVKNQIINKWQLTNEGILSQSQFTHNFVFSAYSERYKKDVVVKLFPLDQSMNEYNYEKGALEVFDGHGCVRLIDYDLENRALMLDLIQPGTSLAPLFLQDDAAATKIAASVIQQLHSTDRAHSNLQSFPTVMQWMEPLSKSYTNIPIDLLKKARKLVAKVIYEGQARNKIYFGFKDTFRKCEDCDGKGYFEDPTDICKKCHAFGRIQTNYMVTLACDGKNTYVESCTCQAHSIHQGTSERLENKLMLCSYVLACLIYLTKNGMYFECKIITKPNK